MSSTLDNLETAVQSLLARDDIPTPAKIRELIQQFRLIESCNVADAEAEQLARRLEMRHGVTMTIGAVLTERQYQPWLDAQRASITPYYWSRYQTLLRNKGFSGRVMATLDDVTDRVLGLLENPNRDGPWDRRGMVVGHVQSGKTANYTGLICKAADAGYKLIVVIAGIHNNLRNQTQLRIDEGFVGRDSARLLSQRAEHFVGVGRYDQQRRPITFTNSVRDFNKLMATSLGIPLQNLREPAVFVIKKAPTTLRNLVDWLREHSAGGHGSQVDIPMLLIDDEADNASINIAYGEDRVSRINGQIRELLSLFNRSCYVGYTATPFANIFIDPRTDDEMLGHDLFPRHFIVSLDPPSNYFGPDRVFLDAETSVVRHIDDHETHLPLRHRVDHSVASLPETLITAIRAFVLGRAIRLARGHVRAHCSMLVNASRFTNVQKQLRDEIHTCLEGIQASARVNGALPSDHALRDPEIAALRDVWLREYAGTEVPWDTVLSHLHDSAAPVKVVEVNSRSTGALNYNDHSNTGLSVIAVGGLSLSRGLTLEGLMTSYFLRNSMMYDTLMQMGRWFGYRQDYADLCRVWMPEEAEGWYAHIAESTEMLRDELRRMEAAGATPEQFGLKVRAHPDTLIVTARNKLGTGERVVASIGLANSLIETTPVRCESAVLQRHIEAASRLVANIQSAGVILHAIERNPSGLLFCDTPVRFVKQFLSAFDNHPGSLLTDPEPVRRYIEARETDELALWDIFFPSLRTRTAATTTDTTIGIPIARQRRTAGTRSDTNTLHLSNKGRVSSRGVEKAGLAPEAVMAAEARYRMERGISEAHLVNYPDKIYRDIRLRPLLIIHLLDVDSEPDGLVIACPVVAWGISFPKSSREERRVDFVVNTQWLQEHYSSEVAEDDMEADDE